MRKWIIPRPNHLVTCIHARGLCIYSISSIPVLTFVYCSIRCCFVRFAFIVCYVCDWYTNYWDGNGEWVPFGTGPSLRLNIPRFFLVSHWILCALDGKHYFLNCFIFFFCVLLRCIQKSICVRPVTHLMATGMACTKNPFAWSVHARAAVCMVWAQWYTAHLARPDGSTVPIYITSSETPGVPAYDEHVGCITVIDQ